MATLVSPTRAESADSSMSITADVFSNVASSSSTPPTTITDSDSLASETPKQEIIAVVDPINQSNRDGDTTDRTTQRPRRARTSLPVYNIAKLSGTDIHGKRRARGDIVSERRRRTISGDTLIDDGEGENASKGKNGSTSKQLVQAGIDALDLQWSVGKLSTPKGKKNIPNHQKPTPARVPTRSNDQTGNISRKISSLGKRSRDTLEKGVKSVKDATKIPRELRRLQDTNEFAGIETQPVIYTTWAKGKLVVERKGSARKKAKLAQEVPKEIEKKAEEPTLEAIESSIKRKRVKKWLNRGLYAGQDAPADATKGLNPSEKKALAQIPELLPSGPPNKTLPQPIFNGLRFLIKGRDFKLPFDVCNPLPPGQPKPDDYRKMTKNRFVGDAAAVWKKTPHFKDFQSKCVCKPEDGCAEDCQNRIMLYECDETNCNVGRQYCQNRAFQELTERTKAGGKYRVGVEILKTADRGYGIRANRCFDPNQIIMEYNGEIITEEECDRRMNEKYKDNKCYYLMSFDQNMIIDATAGSITRFVNHSCEPNCRMIKWIVSGQPRMALFSGDRPIMTGEELTYDYKFDPFSAKNVQKCLCGSEKCRGVLGPKPKEAKQPKPVKDDLKKAIKASVSKGKRKLKELLGDENGDDGSAAKKRKIKTPTGVKSKGLKRSLSTASIKAAKGAATVIKRSVSTISVSAKSAIGSRTPTARSPSIATLRKSSVVKSIRKAQVQTKLTGSRSSSLTIVAASEGIPKAGKGTPTSARRSISSLKRTPTSPKTASASRTAAANKGTKSKRVAKSPSPRKGLDLSRAVNQIRVVQSPSADPYAIED